MFGLQGAVLGVVGVGVLWLVDDVTPHTVVTTETEPPATPRPPTHSLIVRLFYLWGTWKMILQDISLSCFVHPTAEQ